jgi:hypothetical protein
MRVGSECALSHSVMRPLGLILPLSSLHLALAITLPIRGFRSDFSHLSKRSNLTGISIKNGGNVIYGADINLGGNNFSVVLDTGRHVYSRFLLPFLTYPTLSADLWVAGTVSKTNDTGKQVSVAYAVGNVKGTYIPLWGPTKLKVIFREHQPGFFDFR